MRVFMDLSILMARTKLDSGSRNAASSQGKSRARFRHPAKLPDRDESSIGRCMVVA